MLSAGIRPFNRGIPAANEPESGASAVERRLAPSANMRRVTAQPPIAARMASFAVDTRADAIPARVRERASLHLLDVVGCGLAAVGTGAAGQAAALAVVQGGRPEASLIGHGKRVPAALAAFANGTRCHGLDYDDTHEAGICHASTVVAPAALAVGEATASSGAQVLDAYVVGCEVALRIAVAAADGLYQRGFHPTGVCGAFGAAAAAGRLLGLDARTATAALGIVGSFASGLLEYLSEGSATKPLHAGWAAQSGIQAATLAAAGGTGPARVLDGRFGLLAAHTGSAARAEAIGDHLGERWETTEMSIKPFPACHFAHASTWAVAEIVDEQRLTAADIAEVVARIPPEGLPLVLDPIEAKVAPKTPYDAKFSLPYTIAHHVLRGSLELTAFAPERIAEPDVLALARRVRHEPLSPADGPASRFAGGARVVTRDGAEHDRFLAHAPGSPRKPLDDAWIGSKFRANAELALTPADAAALAGALRDLAAAPTLEPALKVLRAAAPR
jgi:2-methylcitrate dehydratase PrpD